MMESSHAFTEHARQKHDLTTGIVSLSQMKLKYRKMKKRIITVVVAFFMAMAPAMSQIFILEDEEGNDHRQQTPSDVAMILSQNVDDDQYKYVPAGGGALLFIGFGAAYAMLKRRKNDNKR